MRLNVRPGGSGDPGWHCGSPRHTRFEFTTDPGGHANGSRKIFLGVYFEDSEHCQDRNRNGRSPHPGESCDAFGPYYR